MAYKNMYRQLTGMALCARRRPCKISTITHVPLDNPEKNEEQAKTDKSPNDRRVVPTFRGTTPLNGENVTDDGRQNDESTEGIRLQELFAQACLDELRCCGC